MTPIQLILWVLATATALVIVALAIALAVLLIRAALTTPLGKQAHDQATSASDRASE